MHVERSCEWINELMNGALVSGTRCYHITALQTYIWRSERFIVITSSGCSCSQYSHPSFVICLWWTAFPQRLLINHSPLGGAFAEKVLWGVDGGVGLLLAFRDELLPPQLLLGTLLLWLKAHFKRSNVLLFLPRLIDDEEAGRWLWLWMAWKAEVRIKLIYF